MPKEELKKLELLIEEVVAETFLNEYDADYSSSGDDLVSIFVSPFVDIIKTAKGELEKGVAIGASTIASLAKQAAVLVIPFLANSIIDDIQEKSEEQLKQRLSKINSRYADVLQKNWDTIRRSDVWGLTFMLDPSFGIAERFILRAPYAALGTLEVLTGGNPKVSALKDKAAEMVKFKSPKFANALPASFWTGDYGLGEAKIKKPNLLKEQEPSPEERKAFEEISAQVADAVKKLKADKSVIISMQTSPVAKELHAGAVEAIMDTAKPVLSATTYEQLKQALGKDFEKFEQDFKSKIPENIDDPEEVKKMQDEMVPAIKDSYKKVLTTKLADLKKQHPNIIKSVNKLIQKINSI